MISNNSGASLLLPGKKSFAIDRLLKLCLSGGRYSRKNLIIRTLLANYLLFY